MVAPSDRAYIRQTPRPGQSAPSLSEDTPITDPLLIGLASLVLSAALIPLVKRLAWALDLVDRPDAGAHKSHTRPTPYGGGIALFVSTAGLIFAATAWAPAAYDRPPLLVLLLTAGALFVLGLVDDRYSLPPLPRFAVQLAAAVLFVAYCPACRLAYFGPLPDAALSVFWLVAMTNAFNFLDNMDGLTAGIGAIALLGLTIIALSAGLPSLALIALALLGATVGFLFYNFPPASVFMGDAGGFFLGFTAAALCLWADAAAASPVPLAALTLLSVPAYDQFTVILIRLRRGAAPWHGDHNHISHRLVRLGLSRRGAVVAIYAFTLLTAAPALALQAGAPPATLLLTPLLLVLTGLLDYAARHRTRLPPIEAVS